MLKKHSGEDKDQQIVVSRKTLRTIASELSLVRDSINGNLKRLETEYIQARRDGAKEGDPKERMIKGNLERQRKDFNRVVSQLKQLRLLAEGK